jgi:hypothetical protein
MKADVPSVAFAATAPAEPRRVGVVMVRRGQARRLAALVGLYGFVPMLTVPGLVSGVIALLVLPVIAVLVPVAIAVPVPAAVPAVLAGRARSRRSIPMN